LGNEAYGDFRLTNNRSADFHRMFAFGAHESVENQSFKGVNTTGG
jgi:hypothetical protein